MLNVVYVLTSTEEDYFYEQFLISVTSLKHYMKQIHTILVIEQETDKYIKKFHNEVNCFVNQIIVNDLPKEYSMAARSRILKTKMRELVQGDFLYIDCDTVICESLESIQDLNHSAAVLDNHCCVNNAITEFQPVIERAGRFHFSVGYHNKHLNTGVLWCRDDEQTRNFFRRWNQLWEDTYKQGVLADQLSFNEVNNRMDGCFKEMDGTWNCQLRYGLPFLAEAKIIHYFASNIGGNSSKRTYSYILTDLKMLRKMRKCGGISEEVYKIICQPRRGFNTAMIIETGTPDYYIINTNIGRTLRYIYRKHSTLFFIANNLLGKIKN